MLLAGLRKAERDLAAMLLTTWLRDSIFRGAREIENEPKNCDHRADSILFSFGGGGSDTGGNVALKPGKNRWMG